MAIRIKPLEEMLREIIATLQASDPTRPAFTLLLGSGFSFPIIPTPSQMLKGDIAWWRFCKKNRLNGPFQHRADAIAKALATEDAVSAFEKQMWATIRDKFATLTLGSDGLPDLKDPESVGIAYQAIMCEGLTSNKMRRQYLRDAIMRSHPKVNGAHIFLAGILEAQEGWHWGAPFCRTIFTTNFDPLLQRSLQLVNKLYYMTDRPDVLEPPDDDESDAIHLVYTHGSVHRYQLLNTGDQIDQARKRNAPTLIDYFAKHGVVVIGYSGWRDTTMEALMSCASFDSNLYWCDVHSAADAETRLRPEVLEILRSGERNAYYVPIQSADEAMRQMHRELNLGDVPKFILGPIPTMISQLRSIEVPSAHAVTDTEKVVSGSLATLLDGTLKRLDVARSAFDDPSIVKPASAQDQKEVANALTARLMNDAYVAFSAGKFDEAITLWTTVIDTEELPSRQRASALLNRGATHGDLKHVDQAERDYSAVIDIPDAPVELRAWALINRAILLSHLKRYREAIDDASAAINLSGVSVEQVAQALVCRSFAYNSKGDWTQSVADTTAVIDMPTISAESRAGAYLNRGVAKRNLGNTASALEDLTVAIETPAVSTDVKVTALDHRSRIYRQTGRDADALRDVNAILAFPDAKADRKAGVLVNESWDLFERDGDAPALITGSRAALAQSSANTAARMNLALGLLITGEWEAAKSEYQTLAANADPAAMQAAIDDLTNEMKKRPDLAHAEEMLQLLQKARG